MTVRRGVVLACSVAVAGATGGCVPDDAIRGMLGAGNAHTATFAFRAAAGRQFVGQYTVRFLSMGTITRHGTQFSATGGIGVGTMSFRLAHRDSTAQRRFGEFAHGAFRSRFVYSGDAATGQAAATATVLTTFPTKKAGTACFRVTVRYSQGGRMITNGFRILGGTGDAVQLRGSGTYQRMKLASGKVAVHGSAVVSAGSPRGFPPQCRG